MGTATAEFKVGDTLWFVSDAASRRGSGGHAVTIEAVGRKWLTLSNREKCDAETLALREAFGNRVYLSEADFLTEKKMEFAFSSLKNKLGWCPKDGVTIDDIREAARLLRIELQDT